MDVLIVVLLVLVLVVKVIDLVKVAKSKEPDVTDVWEQVLKLERQLTEVTVKLNEVANGVKVLNTPVAHSNEFLATGLKAIQVRVDFIKAFMIRRSKPIFDFKELEASEAETSKAYKAYKDKIFKKLDKDTEVKDIESDK